MSKSKSLQNTKMVLRSLVNSNPGGMGMTIDQLNKDYRQEENEPIPYRSLGFTNLESFLCSLDDTLVVCVVCLLYILSNLTSLCSSLLLRFVPIITHASNQFMRFKQKCRNTLLNWFRIKNQQRNLVAAALHLDNGIIGRLCFSNKDIKRISRRRKAGQT